MKAARSDEGPYNSFFMAKPTNADQPLPTLNTIGGGGVCLV